MANNFRNGKLIYHLTSLENLASILQNGLLSRKILFTAQGNFADIADDRILNKRAGFSLDEYVPFHFSYKSAFDAAVQKDYPDTNFIYICVHRDTAKNQGFEIITRHPINIFTKTGQVDILSYDEGINQIEWDIMEQDNYLDQDVKEVRMAECLIKDCVPVEWFQSILVKDEATQTLVNNLLTHVKLPYGKKIFCNISPYCFRHYPKAS